MPRRTAAESRLTDLAELELAEPRTSVERWTREQDGWWLSCGGTNAQLTDAVVLSRRTPNADLGEQAQRLGEARVHGGREGGRPGGRRAWREGSRHPHRGVGPRCSRPNWLDVVRLTAW